MFSNKVNISYFIFISLIIIAQVQTLVELPIVKDNNIAIVEKVLRNTVNNLFTALKIQNVKHNRKLKQHSKIHNFFISITLQDCNNLKEIAKLTRVNNIDNNTQHFITQINEVLNEDDKSNEDGDNNVHLKTYINTFIKKLKYLKDVYIPTNNTVINADILKYLHHHNYPPNVTDHNTVKKTNGTNENVLSDNQFWHPSGRRIYRGIRTSIKTFPFMASVQFFRQFHCAGSIIKEDLIITSSSCLQIAWNNRFFRENPSFLSVQVGSGKYESDGENIAVLEIIFHPLYDPTYMKNNLAIMRLTRKILLRNNKRVQKIEYDRNPWPMPINADRIIVVGWGAKDTKNYVGDVYTNILSFAELDHYPLIDCQEHYSANYVTEKNFCAGFYSAGAGACNRDAGGPGIIGGTLMGVISFGSPICGARDSPTVFTKLGFYTDWIDTIMEQATPYQGASTTTLPRKSFFPVVTDDTPTMMFTPVINDRRSTIIPQFYKPDKRLTENQEFEDFLSTIFDSEENEEYFDRAYKLRYPKTSSKTKTTGIDSQNKLSSLKEYSNDSIRTGADTDIEGDIMDLIKNLNIDHIVKSKKVAKDNKHTSEKSAEGISSSSDIDNSNDSDEQSAVNYLSLYNEENKLTTKSDNKEDEEESGLSIPTDVFKEKENQTIIIQNEYVNKTKQSLSLSSMAELITLAIDEETRRLKSKHYTL